MNNLFEQTSVPQRTCENTCALQIFYNPWRVHVGVEKIANHLIVGGCKIHSAQTYASLTLALNKGYQYTEPSKNDGKKKETWELGVETWGLVVLHQDFL